MAQSGAGLAVPVNFSVEGIVDFAFLPGSGNAFNLNVGDPISVTGMFDDDAVAPLGLSEVSFGAGTGNMMDLFLGDITLNETNDVDYVVGFPFLLFEDGVFAGFDYEADIGANGSPVEVAIFGELFIGVDASFNFVDGFFDLDSFETTPKTVPEPATLALLTIGLVGVGFAGRRKLVASAD